MLTNGFTVFHKNTDIAQKLGRGFVVGELPQKTTIQTQGTVVKDGQEVPAIITEEEVKIHYQVLWENARTVSPSLHASTDLVWEMLTEEYVALSLEDDEDEENDEGEEEEEDTTDFIGNSGIDTTDNETTNQ